MKSLSFRPSRIYSAISFAVATAMLSITALSASAEVSGVDHHPQLNVPEAVEKTKTFMAFNHRASIPTLTVTAVLPSHELQAYESGYNLATLDELEKRMNAELTSLIELGNSL